MTGIWSIEWNECATGLKNRDPRAKQQIKTCQELPEVREKVCSVITCFSASKYIKKYTEVTVDCAPSVAPKIVMIYLMHIIYNCNPHISITEWWKQSCLIYFLMTSYITFTALVSVTFQTTWQKIILGDLLSVSPETTLSVYSTFPRMNGWGTCGWLQAQHMALGCSIVWAVWIVARVSWEDTGACVRAEGVPSKSVTF